MLEGINVSLVQGLSAVGLLITILFLMLMALKKGLIYVRPQVEEIKALYQGRVDDAQKRVDDAKERENQWRGAAEKWQQTAQDAISNNEMHLEQGRMTIALLESVRSAQRGSRR